MHGMGAMLGKADRSGGEGQDISMRRVSAAICKTNERERNIIGPRAISRCSSSPPLACICYIMKPGIRYVQFTIFQVHDSLRHHHVEINGNLIQNKSDYFV